MKPESQLSKETFVSIETLLLAQFYFDLLVGCQIKILETQMQLDDFQGSRF